MFIRNSERHGITTEVRIEYGECLIGDGFVLYIAV